MGGLSSVVALVACAIPIASCDPVRLQWASAVYPGSVVGPDGPWQAIAVSIGSATNGSGIPESGIEGMPGDVVYMFPCGGSATSVMTTGSQAYSRANSSTWTPYDPAAAAAGAGSNDSLSHPDDWTMFYGVSGVGGYDNVFMPQQASREVLKVNTTIFAGTGTSTETSLKNGNYTPTAGVLGLGPYLNNSAFPNDFPAAEHTNPSILKQLQTAGKIDSMSFGLHFGSASLGQTGSLVLGGYDQNRLLGQVGVFKHLLGIPFGFLLDVRLGVEAGASPFNQSGDISVFKGLGGNQQALDYESQYGGPTNGPSESGDSALVIFNPATPYIQLPPGTCEAAAAYLPVTWNDTLGLYLWNTADPMYKRVISSPAYLSFLISDKDGSRITIKVPFQLLNLTLEAPLTASPTQYFPCVSNPFINFWELGRAFLQAAFLGVTYDSELAFVAQAPGPQMDQSVIQTVNANATNLSSNDIAGFERSWRALWTPIPGSSNGTSSASSDASQSQRSLNGGQITGIAIGCLAAVLLLAVLAGFLFRRRRERQRRENARGELHAGAAAEAAASQPSEKDGKTLAPVYEVGDVRRFELASSSVASEADPSARLHEVPADLHPYELPARLGAPNGKSAKA